MILFLNGRISFVWRTGAAVPMVEATIALVLVDQLMTHYAQCHMFPINPELQEPVRVTEVEAAEKAALHS